MSPGHSHAPAPCRIRSTWHPAAVGWMPRKWWYPPSLVTLYKPSVGFVLQNRIVHGRKSVSPWSE